jgi:YVTN family beta-propeller protein
MKFVKWIVSGIITLIGLTALSVITSAAAVMINFEDLSTGGSGEGGQVLVSRQYADQGITFNDPFALDYSKGLPIRDFAHSGTKAIEQCYSKEFCTTPIQMTFTAGQKRVKVWVGYSEKNPVNQKTVILRAFDSAGVQVGQATATFQTSTAPIPIQTPLEVISDSAKIYSVTVNMAHEANNVIGDMGSLAVDDVEFDTAESQAPYAYITNAGSNTVSVIDTATNTITATVPVGSNPNGVAVTPDGTKVYVANSDWDNVFAIDTVSVIDTAINNVTATVDVGGSPSGVAVTPDGTKVYVTNDGSNTVSVIDTATNNVTATVPVGTNPRGVAVSPDGTKVYVANSDWWNSVSAIDTVSVIDTANDTVTANVSVGSWPLGVAVNPNGTKVYVANYGSNTTSVIDTATNKVTDTVPVGWGPVGVAVSPDGTKVYVVNYHTPQNVYVIDTATNKVTATVPVGKFSHGVAVTPDGTKVYVTNDGSNTVSVIDTATNNVTNTVKTGSRPMSWGQFIGPAPVNNDANIINQKDINEILNAHNNYRKAVGAPPLIWDNQLAASAQKWADHLAGIKKLEHSGPGENLAWGKFGTWTQTIDYLASEQKCFKNGVMPDIYNGQCNATPNCAPYKDWRCAGHYSQIVWSSTQKVGAGKSGDYWVLQYSPPGNVWGQKAY